MVLRWNSLTFSLVSMREMLLPAAAASPESVGTWRWGCAYGHSWFVDRAAGVRLPIAWRPHRHGFKPGQRDG